MNMRVMYGLEKPSTKIWYHQQESNLYLALRRHSFYPLNYGGTSRGEAVIVFGGGMLFWGAAGIGFSLYQS